MMPLANGTILAGNQKNNIFPNLSQVLSISKRFELVLGGGVNLTLVLAPTGRVSSN